MDKQKIAEAAGYSSYEDLARGFRESVLNDHKQPPRLVDGGIFQQLFNDGE